MPKGARQLSLDFPCGHGGKRKNAGRKPKGERPGVSHLTRARLVGKGPVFVTTRLHRAVGNLRSSRRHRVVRAAIRRAAERFGMRIVHYSLQRDHLHLLVEVVDRVALSRGMQGLNIRIARALNRVANRRGKAFGDRYHARQLSSPLEVRRALVYVLNNGRKHALQRGEYWSPRAIDSYSSACHFGGWRRPTKLLTTRSPPVTVPASSWLLAEGWARHGKIDPSEIPSAATFADAAARRSASTARSSPMSTGRRRR
jgi:REP element-mobilizing transposase RayT